MQEKTKDRLWSLGPGRSFVLGMATSAATVALIGRGSACDATAAGIGSGILAAAVFFIVSRFTSMRGRRLAGVTIGVVLIVATALGLFVRREVRHAAFTDAFGRPPVASIREFTASRHYAGGPGDMVTFMHFQADRAVLDDLVRSLPASEETWELEQYRKGEKDWPSFWRTLFGFDMADRAGWQVPAQPLPNPQLHRRFV